MKNKYSTYLFLIFIFLSLKNFASGNEFIFNTAEIEIIEKGNIIKAANGDAISIKDNIKIDAKRFEYNKVLSTLNATNGIATSLDGNIEIKAEKFIYNNNLSIINAIGNVQLKDLKKKIIIKSENIFYYVQQNIIKSDTNSNIKDSLGNTFVVKSFNYTLNDALIKLNKAKVTDLENNKIQLEKAYLNLNSNKLIAKDVAIDFSKQFFEKNNDPRLKGSTLTSNGNETIITKGVFTTCKKRDGCPPWVLTSKEMRHDKKKKTIYYKDAWLRLYDKPVFYFPKFFHPDFSVKRQSGFLMPTFEDSSSLGGSFHVPYYLVLADNKDFTFKPRLYSNDKVLIQSEYRQINSNSDHLLDFSIMQENNKTSKNHFFSKTSKELNFANFEESELDFNLQLTSNDTYLKTYKLKSPIIRETNILTSSLQVNNYREDLSITTNFYVIEDLGKKDSDKYEFVYPAYDLNKKLNFETMLDGDFSINSSGHLKNYNTNSFEKVLINDFIFNSDAKYTNSGFKNNYNFLIKNVNTEADKSNKYRKARDHQLASIIEYNSSYPLKKKLKNNHTNILKPIASLKFSPNDNKDMKNEDNRIDINNIYSLNRLSSKDTVEGGASLTYGTEFSKTNNSDKEIYGAKLANILRVEENKNLPKNSKLGNKTSDFVGNLNYDPNNFFKINYDFAMKENLKDTNYQLIQTEFKVNNFISTFEYLNENNTKNKESYLTNITGYNFSDSKNLMFKTRKNKKTSLTEFYNLIYEYTNDCLVAALEYNKDYYNDRDFKASETIFFKLTIIPFGLTKTPNLR